MSIIISWTSSSIIGGMVQISQLSVVGISPSRDNDVRPAKL